MNRLGFFVDRPRAASQRNFNASWWRRHNCVTKLLILSPPPPPLPFSSTHSILISGRDESVLNNRRVKREIVKEKKGINENMDAVRDWACLPTRRRGQGIGYVRFPRINVNYERTRFHSCTGLESRFFLLPTVKRYLDHTNNQNICAHFCFNLSCLSSIVYHMLDGYSVLILKLNMFLFCIFLSYLFIVLCIVISSVLSEQHSCDKTRLWP